MLDISLHRLLIVIQGVCKYMSYVKEKGVWHGEVLSSVYAPLSLLIVFDFVWNSPLSLVACWLSALAWPLADLICCRLASLSLAASSFVVACPLSLLLTQPSVNDVTLACLCLAVWDVLSLILSLVNHFPYFVALVLTSLRLVQCS